MIPGTASSFRYYQPLLPHLDSNIVCYIVYIKPFAYKYIQLQRWYITFDIQRLATRAMLERKEFTMLIFTMLIVQARGLKNKSASNASVHRRDKTGIVARY